MPMRSTPPRRSPRRVGSGRAVLTVGKSGDALKLESLARDGFAQALRVAHGGRTYDIRLPLPGDYQASNALLAAGLAIAAGEPADRVLPALAGLKGVKGRLEIVGRARGGLIVIDYAHKPDALEAALKALRAFAPGRLVCVFGCGGDRDKGKRPIMGRIAARLANHVIVTDDNPRSEAPQTIRAEILAGCPGSREIGDRAEAIRAGARLLGEGDMLLIAGKGHETGQIVGSTVLPFSDHEAVRAALAETPIRCLSPCGNGRTWWLRRTAKPMARLRCPSPASPSIRAASSPATCSSPWPMRATGTSSCQPPSRPGRPRPSWRAPMCTAATPAARCCASTIRCGRWKASAAPRAHAATGASLPSRAASARPAPRRCCATA